MKNDNEKKNWAIVGFPVDLRLWFAARCKERGKTIAAELRDILNKLKKEETR